MHLNTLRRQILEARDARAGTIARVAAEMPAGRALVFLSLNLPGPEKNLARADAVLAAACEALLRDSRGAFVVEQGRDALGPWAIVVCEGRPAEVKRRCVAIEEATPGGRLVDLDVFASCRAVAHDVAGPDRRAGQDSPLSRATLGLPPRRCLVCDEPAVDCIRTGRHGTDELRQAVEDVLRADEGARLADALVRAARVELELTPKPGLVDRRDNGSHPDLSFELMSRSIDLLPEYYRELLEIARGIRLPSTRATTTPLSTGKPDPAHIDACVAAGRRAEERMFAAIHGNAHRGYIFLSGLVLVAAACGAASREAMRAGIAELAGRILLKASAEAGPHTSPEEATTEAGPHTCHGAEVRRRLGVGGIHAEALRGLPSVFDHGLPALQHALASFDTVDTAHHFLLATLMTAVEDTTALHRCGPSGLERLRADGRRLRSLIQRREDCLPLLASLNDEYRATGLTMGGVADCMAITIAVHELGAGGTNALPRHSRSC